MSKIELKVTKWNVEETTGYKPITTFWTDFCIAEAFGKKGVLETYERAFKEWKDDYKHLTELAMVVNWKCFQHYEHDNELARLYSDLYYRTDEYAYGHLEGEEANYYYRILD